MVLTSSTHNTIHILKLNGRFDAYEVPKVAAWLNEQIAADNLRIIMNLAGVSFIDSTGLSTLVQAMKRARLKNGDCRLCGLQQPIRILFELIRLDKAFQIFSDEALAERSYALEPVI